MSMLKINAPSTLDKMVELSNLQSSPFGGKKWYIEVVPCADLTCACRNAKLLFRDWNQINTNEYSFYIEGDLEAQSLSKISFNTYEADLAPLSKPIMLLEELLTEEDWSKLINVHRVAKGVQIDEQDLRNVEADFPKELLKDPSSVVLFKEIFPLSSYFHFDAKDKIPFIVLDQYCSNYKCDCSDMVLTFTKDGRNEDFAFRYNYKTGRVEILGSFKNDISIQEANNYVRLLKEKFKNLYPLKT